MAIGGLELGFKYSGQPVTCHRCQSTDHMVKICPTRRRNPIRGGDNNNNLLDTDGENAMDVQIIPPENTAPPPLSYAAAATGTAKDELSPEQLNEQRQQQRAALEKLKKRSTGSPGETKARPTATDPYIKCPEMSPPTPSDEETKDNNSKKPSLEETPPPPPSSSTETPRPSEPPLKPAGLKPFMKALASNNTEHALFVKKVPGGTFYKCCALYLLHHKYGPITATLAKKHKINEFERSNWEALKETVKQDAYAQLLTELQRIQQDYKLFTSD